MSPSMTQTTLKEPVETLLSAQASVDPVEPEIPIHTVNELIKRLASETTDLPLIGYPVKGLTDFEEHTARDLDRFADAAVVRLRILGLEPSDSSHKEAPVAAILAASNFDVIITLLGLSRLGYSVLCLSTRLSADAYIPLLEAANCNTIITTNAFDLTICEIRKIRKITSLPLLERADYFDVKAPPFHRVYDPIKEAKKIALILHSSGSTGLPKPIFLTHFGALANFAKNWGLRGFITSPLYHSQGLYSLFRSIYGRSMIYIFNYALPITKKNIVETLQFVKPELFHCVPYVLKLLAESQDVIASLARVKIVLFAGSSCPDDLGDYLVDNGVNLVANYGATETGVIMTSFRPPGDKEWSYLRLWPPVAQYTLMDEIAPDIYECVALDGLNSKTATNSNQPPNSFRTRDLFTRHPTKPNFWKYLSRLDDRLTLVNGEKILPIPIEGRIRQDELVQEAVVFGAGKTVPGVLVFRSERALQLSDDDFLEAVWPAIEAANTRAETFSRIPKELVVTLPAHTNYPQTDKGTFIRAKVYLQFEKSIEEAYDRFENGQVGTIALEIPELEQFLLRQFQETLDVSLESVDTDFFAAGIDSLQCIRMWSNIKKQLDLGGRQAELSQNVLYDTGNVAGLAQFLFYLRTGTGAIVNDEISVMKDLISKYSSFQQHTSTTLVRADKEVALVTGTTGSLGAYLLALLVNKENVSKVWTLVRASTPAAAAERVLNALEARGLDLSPSEKSKIIALPADFSRADLGLDDATLSSLRSELSIVIHSAWAVNFNLGVQSFEDQHIRGVHNLIQLCLSTKGSRPARFFFCSSVSSAAGTPRPACIKEGAVEDLSHAQTMGYARSKLVSEHIIRNAMHSTSIYARVLRVGQLVGDSTVGRWNTTEAIPLMIQTATTLKVLPALDEEPSWLPVDYAASIILELAGISAPIPPDRLRDADLVYHVLNPNTFHWTRDLLPALRRAGLSFEQIPPKEWVQRLRASDQDPIRNPPVKLTSFFADKYDSNRPARKGLEYETTETRQDSPTIAHLPDVIQAGFIEKFVRVWMKQWKIDK